MTAREANSGNTDAGLFREMVTRTEKRTERTTERTTEMATEKPIEMHTEMPTVIDGGMTGRCMTNTKLALKEVNRDSSWRSKVGVTTTAKEPAIGGEKMLGICSTHRGTPRRRGVGTRMSQRTRVPTDLQLGRLPVEVDGDIFLNNGVPESSVSCFGVSGMYTNVLSVLHLFQSELVALISSRSLRSWASPFSNTFCSTCCWRDRWIHFQLLVRHDRDVWC